MIEYIYTKDDLPPDNKTVLGVWGHYEYKACYYCWLDECWKSSFGDVEVLYPPMKWAIINT